MDPDGFMLGKEGVRPGFEAVRFTIHIKTSSLEGKLREFKKFMESRCAVSDTLGNGTRVTVVELDVEH